MNDMRYIKIEGEKKIVESFPDEVHVRPHLGVVKVYTPHHGQKFSPRVDEDGAEFKDYEHTKTIMEM